MHLPAAVKGKGARRAGVAAALVIVAAAIPVVRMWSVEHLGIGPAAPVVDWLA